MKKISVCVGCRGVSRICVGTVPGSVRNTSGGTKAGLTPRLAAQPMCPKVAVAIGFSSISRSPVVGTVPPIFTSKMCKQPHGRLAFFLVLCLGASLTLSMELRLGSRPGWQRNRCVLKWLLQSVCPALAARPFLVLCLRCSHQKCVKNQTEGSPFFWYFVWVLP